MIEAACRTNLDDYQREKWPTEFVALPRLGDWVEAESGVRLRVVGVTHRMDRPGPGQCGASVPVIEVELHRING